MLGDDDCINLKCVLRQLAGLEDFILFYLISNYRMDVLQFPEVL